MSLPEKDEYRYCPRKPSLYFLVCVSVSPTWAHASWDYCRCAARPFPIRAMIRSPVRKTEQGIPSLPPPFFISFFHLLRGLNMRFLLAFVEVKYVRTWQGAGGSFVFASVTI